MIFSIAYCGRIWHLSVKRQSIALISFIIAIIVFAYIEHDVNVWMNACDAIVGVGLGVFIFILILREKWGFNLALAYIILFEIGYTFFRSWIFAPQLTSISQQIAPLYESYVKQFPTIKVDKDTIIWLQHFMLDYQSAIWGGMQMIGIFLGVVFFNRYSWVKQPIKLVKLPYELIYLLLISLGLTLYSQTRLWGVNLLICTGMIYLIQGTAVLSFVWGGFFAKAGMLRMLLIFAIILNYPVLVLIAIIGILDVWFDFRKLTLMEEKHESNID